ncbi:hypothetical protein [Paenibacillus sp. URB8-2]|uniref:hypothetical protein n=1 Tax=Paenibacillus sp. URB8-2 TaxID=2741301 RepID=UPI0015BB083D|nr:hypothetical protein [Paenibacillus sp. URB8-2]BCG56800.1 hypothetical protein PUR_02250 [Paenibacillus sp. URB8-2]
MLRFVGYVINFSTKMLFSFALIASMFSGTVVLAADKTQSSVSTNKTVVPVHDIVPKSYFKTYAGKFDSVDELKKAAGYDTNTSKASANLSTNVEPNKSIKVDSLDEYAALLYYYNDLATNAQNNPVEVETNTVSTLASSNDYWTTYSKKWNDNGLSWMYSYVTVHFVDGKINSDPATTDSALLGFHPGNSWEHKAGASYATINSNRTGGYAHIVGILTLSIIWEGVGDITSKQLEHDWSF